MDARTFGLMVKNKRGDYSLRGLAEHLGVSASTLSRVENGYDCDIRTFFRLADWLGFTSQNFDRLPSFDDLDAPEKIFVILSSDDKLPKDQIDAICTIVRMAYEQVAKG